MNTFHGSCHCGAVKIRLRTSKTAEQLGARSCQCSFCKAHGASWTSDPSGSLEITIPSEKVSRYTFGTGTAEFLVCATCGVVPAITWRNGEKLLAVARVNCLAEAEQLLAHTKPIDFDGETTSNRLERRARGWTPASLHITG